MPRTARSQSLPALLMALCLSLICGCQRNDAGFHTYNEPAQTQPPAPVDPSDPASNTGIIPASAQTTKPLPEVARTETPKAHPTTGDATSGEGSASIGSAPPSEPNVPADPSPATHELALSIPPAPPVAVALAEPTTSPFARQLELLIPEKTFTAEGPDGALRVSFDDVDLLKVLNADPVPLDVEQHLPAWLSGLNGKTVRIRGWMFPPPIERELPAFMFVRDNNICCFGRKALVYDKFGVRMRSGETTDYIQGRPFDVVGRMLVRPRVEDGELIWLYMIEDAVVVDQ